MRLILLILLVTLTACAPSAPLPAMVHVRDAVTGASITGAEVRGLGLTIFLPTSQEEMDLPPGGTLGPQPTPPATQGLTDSTGLARITLAGNRPNTLLIHASGYDSLRLLVEAGITNIARPVGWSSGNTGYRTRAHRRLEVRVSTANPQPGDSR